MDFWYDWDIFPCWCLYPGYQGRKHWKKLLCWKCQQYVTERLKDENWYEGLPCVFACVTYFCLWWKLIDVLLSNCTCKVLGGLVMLVVIKEKKKCKKNASLPLCSLLFANRDYCADAGLWLACMQEGRCESVWLRGCALYILLYYSQASILCSC